MLAPILHALRLGPAVFLDRANRIREREKPLLRGVNRQLAAVHRNPTTPKFLRNRRSRSTPSEAVQHDVVRLGRGENHSFKKLFRFLGWVVSSFTRVVSDST